MFKLWSKLQNYQQRCQSQVEWNDYIQKQSSISNIKNYVKGQDNVEVQQLNVMHQRIMDKQYVCINTQQMWMVQWQQLRCQQRLYLY
ncbi:unnamed protein product [Paramecium sonneborni]|uniref:Uncharacterized protein n=1 Tax=Paramecium sonneborni TaxID=65129 RepID=A0A8S1RL47_9CILI|nr:unnamed protein product [Paramecium sonneborni]